MLTLVSKSRRLNRGQRVVVIVALAVALYFAGSYVETLGRSGWVAYAPLRDQATYAPLSAFPNVGLHPWVRLVVWLGLTIIWAACSLALLRSPSSDD
jgi:cytochrome bd-type quinol oxidase subunit 1